MTRIPVLAVLALAAAVVVMPANAQQQRKSPHETISRLTANANRITIVYGRPFVRHPDGGEARRIWGGLVPFGKIWRLGADEATLLITEKPLEISGATIPAGAYTLYMLPHADGSAQLIINRQIGQWGLMYQEDKDVARVPLERQPLARPVEQFTIAIDNGSPNGGVLRFSWEQAQYSAPFVVRR